MISRTSRRSACKNRGARLRRTEQPISTHVALKAAVADRNGHSSHTTPPTNRISTSVNRPYPVLPSRKQPQLTRWINATNRHNTTALSSDGNRILIRSKGGVNMHLSVLIRHHHIQQAQIKSGALTTCLSIIIVITTIFEVVQSA